MNRIHFNVSRLLNTQTKTQLNNVLNDLEGVQMVNIDLSRGTIEVGYDNKETNENQIKQCIEHVGCKIE
ncbi:MAG: heavy metal transport/detoxification protein [Bacillota bacterium]|jgi:copper chaperone CopZ|nr:heavy metal transport/detoxification protein [Bacillota bacterium]